MTDIIIDFSSLSLLGCQRAYQFSAILGIRGESGATNEGKLLHKFACEYTKSPPPRDIGTVLLPFIGEVSDATVRTRLFNMAISLAGEGWLDFTPATDLAGEPGLEYRFCFPFAQTTAHTINLAGTIDRIEFRDDIVWLTDYKTTHASTGYQLDKVKDEYARSRQLPLYAYALSEYLVHLFPPPVEAALRAGRIQYRYLLIQKFLTPPRIRATDWQQFSADDATILQATLAGAIARLVPLYALQTPAPPDGALFGQCPRCWHKAICEVKPYDRLIDYVNRLPKTTYDPRSFD